MRSRRLFDETERDEMQRPRSAAQLYGVAVTSVVVATLARLALNPLLGYEVPYLTYFCAVAFTAWWGGYGPGMLAVALGSLSANLTSLPHERGLFALKLSDAVGMVLFWLVATIIVVLSEWVLQNARLVRQERERFFTTLASIGDGVIVTDRSGRVQYLNSVAEQLTGWDYQAAAGRELKDIFRIANEESGAQVEDPATRVLREGHPIRMANHTLLTSRSQIHHVIDDGAAPIRDEHGSLTGVVLVFRDVSARRAAERALRDSEERFRILTNNAPAAIFIKDVQGRYLLANKMACEALGHPEGVSGLTDFDLMSAEHAQLLRENDQYVIESGEIAQSEVQVGPQGLQFLSVKFPWRDGQGISQGVCGVAVDITERKRAEFLRQEGDRQFQLLADSIPQLAWMAAPDGSVFWHNQRWYDYTGLSPEAAQGWGWQNAIAPAEQQRVLSSWQHALIARHPWEETVPLRRRDGEIRWHLSRALPLTGADGQVVRWFGTDTDISERRRTEATLRFLAEVSDALSSLVDGASTLQKLADLAIPEIADWCVAHTIQPDGSIQQVAISHLNREKLQRVLDYNRQHPAGWNEILAIGEVLRTGQPELLINVTESARRAGLPNDQDRVQLLEDLALRSAISVPLKAHGRLFGVLTFATAESRRTYDASDLHIAEDLAHRASTSLENARLYEDAREADRRKDEFLAMLSHELRNPLAPIRSGLDVLVLEQCASPEMLQVMQEQVNHLVRLVDDLLDISRIVRGRIELRRERVDLNQIVQCAVNTMQSTLDRQQQRVELDLPEESPWLDADPVRLLQVVENLVNNASKYSEPSTTIRIHVHRDESLVHLHVRDEGIGISPELLPRIFELFTQAARSLDRSQGGLGIGLTLVKALVEMHHGAVSATSEGEGQGSEFSITLPIVSSEHAEPLAEQANAPVENCKILVVDDNKGNARIVAALLRRLGAHRIELAYDGAEALETLQRFRPDLVLLDIGLPRIDGFEVGRNIRRQQDLDSVLLVALTGYGQEEDRRRTRNIGFDLHLVKPVSLDQLREVLSHPKLSHCRE
jgi:PAS domain S-box-containing protein